MPTCANLPCLSASRKQLMAHQCDAATLAVTTGGGNSIHSMLIVHGTGLGKTLTAAAIANCALTRGAPGVIIFTKKSVVHQVRREVVGFYNDSRELKAKSSDAIKEERRALQKALSALGIDRRVADVREEIDYGDVVAMGESCRRETAWYEGEPKTREQKRYHETLPPVPPGYHDLYVCKPGSRMLWAARDSKGREQRRYTAEWTEEAHQKRELRVWGTLSTNPFLENFDRILLRDLLKGEKKEEALATAIVRICHFRLMHHDASDEGRYGVTTLEGDHFKKNGVFEFIGKSQQECTCDPRTHEAVRTVSSPEISQKVVELTNKKKRDAAGKGKKSLLFPNLKADRVNAYIHATAAKAVQDNKGLRTAIRPEWLKDLTSKDFRTYGANYIYVSVIKKLEAKLIEEPQLDSLAAHRVRTRQIIPEAERRVSESLNNTVAVARSNYIFHALQRAYRVMPKAVVRAARTEHKGMLELLKVLQASIEALQGLTDAEVKRLAEHMAQTEAVPVWVGTYEASTKDPVVKKWIDGKAYKKNPLLIDDEAHEYITLGTEAYEMLHRLTNRVKSIVLMTATPVV